MALFKKFTDRLSICKASKTELEGFKSRLKYGEDPKELYDNSQSHYKDYRNYKKLTHDLLVKILKPKLSDKYNNWTTMEIQDHLWRGDKKCNKSPIEKHIYLHHFGDDNPLKGAPRVCICCGKEI